MRGVEDVRGRVVLCGRDCLEERNHRSVVGVDGGHDRDVVLKLVELIIRCWCYSDSGVEGVDERGIVRAKRHFADDMREVECC